MDNLMAVVIAEGFVIAAMIILSLVNAGKRADLKRMLKNAETSISHLRESVNTLNNRNLELNAFKMGVMEFNCSLAEKKRRLLQVKQWQKENASKMMLGPQGYYGTRNTVE